VVLRFWPSLSSHSLTVQFLGAPRGQGIDEPESNAGEPKSGGGSPGRDSGAPPAAGDDVPF